MKHCTALVEKSESFNKLRYQLCPKTLTDAAFWKIYFTLLSNNIVSNNLHLDEYLDSRVMGWKHETTPEDDDDDDDDDAAAAANTHEVDDDETI